MVVKNDAVYRLLRIQPKITRIAKISFELLQVEWESGTVWTPGPGVQPQITRISQIFSWHVPWNGLPFLCPQTKIPKIGVIGGYLLLRIFIML